MYVPPPAESMQGVIERYTVYPNEELCVFVYANTAQHVLSLWMFFLDIDSSRLEYDADASFSGPLWGTLTSGYDEEFDTANNRGRIEARISQRASGVDDSEVHIL